MLDDDTRLVCEIYNFLQDLKSSVTYPELMGMRKEEFECRSGSEQGKLFESALGKRLARLRGFQLITEAGSLDMGLGISTMSGIRHEIDLVLSNSGCLYVFEAKHYPASEVTKDMLVIFNHKVLDFYLQLIHLGQAPNVKRVFVTRSATLGYKVREFAFSWGMGLIDGRLRNPLWLRGQLRHWTETRGEDSVPPTVMQMAETIAEIACRDLNLIITPFSSKQVSFNADQLLGPDKCAELVHQHEVVDSYVIDQMHKQPGLN